MPEIYHNIAYFYSLYFIVIYNAVVVPAIYRNIAYFYSLYFIVIYNAVEVPAIYRNMAYFYSPGTNCWDQELCQLGGK